MADFITAGEVLRLQADMRDRFGDLTFCSATAHSYEYLNGNKVEPTIMQASMKMCLEYAKAYRVEHQMTQKIVDRAMYMSDDHHIGEPPAPAGFVVFEEPIVIKEMRGRTELIHALAWGSIRLGHQTKPTDEPKTERGILVSTWNDVYRQPDEVWESMEEWEKTNLGNHAGRWSLTMIRPMINWEVGPDWIDIDPATKQMIIDEGVGEPQACTFNMLRLYAAVFDMLGETVPVSKRESAELTRTERKQAKHNKVTPEVCLVTLRPEYNPEPKESHPGTGTPLSVRVAMGNPNDPDDIAYYRTIHKGTERERRVPVHSHWRGPEDAPVSQRKTVRNLAR